jgi:hypothetical protein
MSLNKLFLAVLFSLLIISCSTHKQTDDTIVRKHFAEDFQTIVNLDTSSQVNILTAFLGEIRPIYESAIFNVNVIEKDSNIIFYYDLGMSDADSNQYLQMTVSKEKNQVFFYSELIKSIPRNSLSLEIFRNDINRDIGPYPFYQKWQISENDEIECKTFQGCIDTDRANLTILKNKVRMNTLSNLGWISLIKYDIDGNGKKDAVFVSNKFCLSKLDFYAVLF